MEGVVRSKFNIPLERFEYEEESEQAAPRATPVRARILWPALGFPAVIAPRNRPPGSAMLDADTDASRTICVLLLSNRKYLSKAEAAKYLRYVPWAERGRRHIRASSFAEEELSVRNDGKEARLALPGAHDKYGAVITFGANRDGENGVVVSLAQRVLKFYREQIPIQLRTPYLHEIRISEAKSGRLQDGLYHLFWNNELANEDVPSDEMALLLREFVPRRRAKLGTFWQPYRVRLFQEYEYEYGVLRASYAAEPVRGRPRAEILHPLFVRRNTAGPLKIGHITDTHVDVRADVYEENLKRSNVAAMYPGKWRPDSYNNWNRSFVKNYNDAKRDSHILLLTGDLIDYGRGHWGVQGRNSLGDDSYYHEDRNWFLFYYLLASRKAYEQPTYTILGNHDWRLNPYPPFAIAGAPSPKLLINNYENFSDDQQKEILRIAHGPGHDRKLSYNPSATGKAQALLSGPVQTLVQALKRVGRAIKTIATLLKTAVRLVFQASTVDEKGSPAETRIESVEWYLFTINPFFDYWFTLPTGQKVLMLDWAENENVLFPIVDRGESFPYMLWQLSAASDPGPKARNCLTKLQQRLVKDFTAIRAPAKIIGIHAPPIGPYPDWYDGDLLKGVKIYDKSVEPRGPTNYMSKNPDGSIQKWNGHPLFAIKPRTAGAGVVADYGSFDSWRDDFLKLVTGRSSGVRLVFSGHIHRNGLYVAHVPSVSTNLVQAGNMHLRGVAESLVRGARPPAVAIISEGRNGPLFVNTTSAGPRGNSHPALKQDAKVEPGYARAQLASDGTIHGVEFRPPMRLAVPIPTRPAQREASFPAHYGPRRFWQDERWPDHGAL
jgi:Calcineurin-like phosphoesterase